MTVADDDNNKNMLTAGFPTKIRLFTSTSLLSVSSAYSFVVVGHNKLIIIITTITVIQHLIGCRIICQNSLPSSMGEMISVSQQQTGYVLIIMNWNIRRPGS